MQPLASALSTAAAFALFAATGGADIAFHVAPDGTDGNAGTREGPFATIARAQTAVRALVAEGLDDDVRIVIAGGRYELDEPLVFGPADSGTGDHSITYAAAPRETVVVSGGRPINGWRRAEGDLWQTTIPEVAAGEWYFRELFVDGRPALRARMPNRDDDPWFLWLTGAEQAEDLSEHRLTLDPGQVAAWSNVADAEAIVFGEWEITRKRLAAVDAEAGTVTLKPPHVKQHPAINPRAGMACYFENAPEMLNQPGEWYLDRQTGVLTYWARPGEDLATAEVIAPKLTRLEWVKGSAGATVRNVHFDGLQFSHCAWPLPEAGHAGVQGTFHTPPPNWGQGWAPVDAAIVWEHAERCSFTNGRIANVGGAGVRLKQGCRDNLIQGNEIVATGGNGVMVGEHLPGFDWENETLPDEEAVVGNLIDNNRIHGCGRDYYGAVGVWVGFTDGTVVSHNTIQSTPYTGVSVGWRWNETPTACKNNVIEYNHIFDVMGVLADGGCIYTLGLQPGTVLRGNVLHNVHYSSVARQSSRSNNGIFFDQGSKQYLVEENVIYATAGPPIRFNQCQEDWHIWRANHFGITAPVEGKRGMGLRCDGGYVEEPHAPELDGRRLTVEAWIYPDALASGRDDRRWIVNKNGNEWREGHWALMIRDRRVGAYLNIGGGQANMLEAWSEDDVLTMETWQHIAMTYDGHDLDVYHNGLLVASREINRERVPGDSPVNIARRQDGYITFHGRIDEVAIYDRALSAGEIKARYEADGTPPDDVDGVARQWSFEDHAGDAEVIEKALERAGIQAPFRERLLPEATQ